MGFLIYFIGYIIATCIILFVMNDDWKTEGVTISDWLACSIFGSLSWAFVLGFFVLCIVFMSVMFIKKTNILNKYLINPKN